MIEHVYALAITADGQEMIHATRSPGDLFTALAEYYPPSMVTRGDVFRSMRLILRNMVVGRHRLDDRIELLIAPIPAGKP